MSPPKKYPERIYLSDPSTFDGPFLTCSADMRSIVEEVDHGDWVAIYKLIKVGKAVKELGINTNDLATPIMASAGPKRKARGRT